MRRRTNHSIRAKHPELPGAVISQPPTPCCFSFGHRHRQIRTALNHLPGRSFPWSFESSIQWFLQQPLGAECQLTPLLNRRRQYSVSNAQHGTQPPDSSYEVEESGQRLATKPRLLIHDFESSKATPSLCQFIAIKEVPSQQTYNQWCGQSPLGAGNTTDSLLTMRRLRSA